MTDILQLLDTVIDQIGEECSSVFPEFPSSAAQEKGTGTPKSLAGKGFSALPAVPVAADDVHDNTRHDVKHAGAASDELVSIASLASSLSVTGITGNTGKAQESYSSAGSRGDGRGGKNGNATSARLTPEINLTEHGLVIDFETRSTANLKKVGPFVYAESTWTQVWVACYAIGSGPVQVWHPGDPVPADLAAHVTAGLPLVAHNSLFERTIWAKIMTPDHGWPATQLEQWHCTAAMAAAMGLPRKLEDVAKHFVGVPQKDMQGHRLMLRMARPASIEEIPCPFCGAGIGEPSAKPECLCRHDRGWRLRVTWYEEAEAVARGTKYCIRDVEAERELLTNLRPLSRSDREVWLLDQRINERGISIDQDLAHNARAIVKARLTELDAELKKVTGGAVRAATQIARLVSWLKSQGIEPPGDGNELGKAEIERLLARADLPPPCRRALEIRYEASKTSVVKLDAYVARTSADGRMRDNLRYYGAGRTGRWSGEGAQLQNLPRAPSGIGQGVLDLALVMMSGGASIRDMECMFIDQTLEVISASLRPMLTAAVGHDLIGGDYNAIEARGAAWLAGARRMLGVFERGEDPYLDMAAQIYGRPANSFSKTSPERQLGKAAVLGLGFQMGAERFQETCEKQGVSITLEEAERVMNVYRTSNPEIVGLWAELQDAAIQAVRQPDHPVDAARGLLRFYRRGTWLYLRLPSGRILSYAHPRLEAAPSPRIKFEGVNSINQKWEIQQIYGGRWCENAVQAICRDLLANALLNLEAAGYPIVLSVHDEAIAEVPEGFGDIGEFEKMMCQVPDWANGFPVKAEGWRAKRYQK